MKNKLKKSHAYPKPDTSRMKTVRARYDSLKEWTYDSKGYLLIKVDYKKKADSCRPLPAKQRD